MANRDQIRMVTKYEQIENMIRERIRKGELKPGDRVESEYELAARLGVHRFTVNKAISNLVRAGMLYREQGKGTFVAEIRPRSETPTIGLLYGGPEESLFKSEFFAPILQGIHKSESFNLLVMGSQGYPSTQTGPVVSEDDLARVDGYFALELFNDEYILRMAEHRPVVLIDYFSEALGMPGVVLDNAGGAGEATRHLLSLGHREIVCVSEDPEREFTDPAWQDRRLGWLKAMKEAGVEDAERLFIALPSRSSEAGVPAAQKALGMEPRPTAAFVASGGVAIAFMKSLQDNGVSVPGEFSVVSFGDSEMCEVVEPAMTAVDISPEEMGREAVRLMEAVLSGKPPKPLRRDIPTELVVRESTGRAPKARRSAGQG